MKFSFFNSVKKIRRGREAELIEGVGGRSS
jgi:hypothetical protein